MSQIYEGCGVRFEYPETWELEVDGDSALMTIDVRQPEGLSFAIVRIDEECPDPELMVEAAVEAMREEYPGLSVLPARRGATPGARAERMVEFFSLDMAATTTFHSFRTPRRTVFFLGQWSELSGAEGPRVIKSILSSLEEYDTDDADEDEP